MAFLISVLLSKSQTASIIGYAVSIWFTTIAVCLNVTVYSPPYEMDWYFYLIPNFTFCRCIYIIGTSCAYDNCVASISGMPDEIKRCLAGLYISFLVYLLLSVYLYQIVPQTYGVPKKWNFLCKRN